MHLTISEWTRNQQLNSFFYAFWHFEVDFLAFNIFASCLCRDPCVQSNLTKKRRCKKFYSRFFVLQKSSRHLGHK